MGIKHKGWTGHERKRRRGRREMEREEFKGRDWRKGHEEKGR